MLRLGLCLPVLVASLTLVGGPAAAREAFGQRGGIRFSTAAKWKPGFDHRYRHHRFRRASAVVLHLDDWQPVNPLIVGVPVPVPLGVAGAYASRTVAELPVSVGIREARPSEAAVFVLNEGASSRPRREPDVGPRHYLGPKILEDLEEVEPPATRTGPSGARIIHLTVPVGSD